MKYHKYDPDTLLYVESVEAKSRPEHSVAGDLPDQTQRYTLAYIDGVWVSVLRPEFETINNEIKLRPEFEIFDNKIQKKTSPAVEE